MNIQDGILFVMVEGKQYGPMKIADLRTGIQRKHFTEEHLVWAPGFRGWRKIGDTPFLLKGPEFAPAFAAPPLQPKPGLSRQEKEPSTPPAAAAALATPNLPVAPIAAPCAPTPATAGDVAIPGNQPSFAAADPLSMAANPPESAQTKKPRPSVASLWRGKELGQKKPPATTGEMGPPPGQQTWRQRFRHKRFILPALGGVALFAIILLVAGVAGWLPLPWGQGAKVEAYDDQAVYTEDNGDWQNYPELGKEQKALAKQQEKCIKALESGDAHEAASYFFPEKQERWEKMRAEDQAGMKELAQVLATSQLIFLGPDSPGKDDPRGRIASFTVAYQGHAFEIVWLKYENTWYLYEV